MAPALQTWALASLYRCAWPHPWFLPYKYVHVPPHVGQPGRIHVSKTTQALLLHEHWEPTGGIEVKGKVSHEAMAATGVHCLAFLSCLVARLQSMPSLIEVISREDMTLRDISQGERNCSVR